MSASTSANGSNKGRRSVDTCREEFTAVAENGKTKMQCNHCRMTITNHTATLKNHLARKHGDGSDASRAAGGESGGGGTSVVMEKDEEDHAAARDQQETNGGVQSPNSDVAPGKKELKKRTQRSSIDKSSHAKGEEGSQEETKQQGAGNGEGIDKKRKIDRNEGDARLPLIDRQEFADMNRGM